MTSDSDSQNASMKAFGFAGVRASETANRMAKKTICSTSFVAAASKKLCGTVCSRTPASVGCFVTIASASAAEAPARVTPTPGFSTFTAIRPTASASVVTISK